MIERLKELDDSCELDKIMDIDIDDMNKNPAGPSRGNEPLFYVKVTIHDKIPVPESAVEKVEIEEFKLPPHGTSEAKDFDLLAHIELEPSDEELAEIQKAEEERMADGEEAEGAAEEMRVATPKYKLSVPSIQEFWLTTDPSIDDYYNIVVNCFSEGLECIKNFERWSKHDDLTPYANALEEWDDMVGDNWDPPDNNCLDPHAWINENPLYLE